MGMLEWAKREIEIACKKENPDWKPGEFDYGCSCYESAMKAFESLLEDGHSGTSMSFTKHILMRLIDGKPLTPIEDTEDVWNLVTDKKETKLYQCKRMSSLFKNVYPDGRVTYDDIDRIICINEDNPDSTYHNGFIVNFVDELEPLTMPYYPKEKPYKVYCEDFLYDKSRKDDYDTRGILYYKDPDGERHEINRYFKFDNDKREEIDVYEYLERKSRYEERIEGSN